MTEEIGQRARRHPSPIAWGIFLGCSWTWCIGMFLPILLVRDFGTWGWLVFAVPNVIGAAAMGWVLNRPGASEHIVEHHSRMCVVFSVVTILYHIYFVGWIIAALIGAPWAAATFALAGLFWMIGRRRPRRDVFVAVVAYLVSLLAFAGFWAVHGPPGLVNQPIARAFGAHGVAWVAPVCILGFLLCPYLDLTFHRARRSTTPDGAKIAFGVGFGIFFLVMILFTLWYAPWYLHGKSSEGMWWMIRWIVGIHMAVQSAFTIAVHVRELEPGPKRITLRGVGSALIALVWAVSLAGGVYWLTSQDSAGRVGEVGYLIFMACYGLVFPAYVWMCIVPGRDGKSGARSKTVRAALVAITIALPMYWVGFMNGWTAWLLPGVLIVVAMRSLIPKGPPILPLETPEILR